MSRPRMPIQPIAKDERGTYRFVKNRIVEMLLEEGPFDMNRIAVQMIERGWTENEYFQFAQLIGYSVNGIPYPDLLSESEVQDEHANIERWGGRVDQLTQMLEGAKAELIEPLARLYDVHPTALDENWKPAALSDTET